MKLMPLIFKPIDIDGMAEGLSKEFMEHNHARDYLSGEEFSLCQVACDEWGYGHKKATVVTCPNCIEVIKHCKALKFKEKIIRVKKDEKK